MLRRGYKRLLKLLAKHTPGYNVRCRLLRMAGYKIGGRVYIGEDLIIIDELDDRARVRIGDRVAIAPRVTLVVSSHPNFSRIQPFVKCVHGYIEIGDDAWLGTGCIILPDVRIGKGAVVGAGSVVTKDVPDFAVVAGVPAKPIKKLDTSSEAAGLWSN
jgi:maltose O-acetyltransferase